MARRTVLLALAALAGLAAAWWFWWVPWWRPPPEPGERYGIDVSSHQGVIDWERVAADGIEFAYVKAREGGDFVDEGFAQNWEGAVAAGVERGAYHFLMSVPRDRVLGARRDVEIPSLSGGRQDFVFRAGLTTPTRNPTRAHHAPAPRPVTGKDPALLVKECEPVRRCSDGSNGPDQGVGR